MLRAPSRASARRWCPTSPNRVSEPPARRAARAQWLHGSAMYGAFASETVGCACSVGSSSSAPAEHRVSVHDEARVPHLRRRRGNADQSFSAKPALIISQAREVDAAAGVHRRPASTAEQLRCFTGGFQQQRDVRRAIALEIAAYAAPIRDHEPTAGVTITRQQIWTKEDE